ncbi:transposase family protein [Riemerella anatipestifer]|nr:transposase family protein [Riemerella anatipestifer]
MNLLATDIIVRKKNAVETVWLSQRLIMEVCGVSEEYLWKVRSKYKSSVKGTYLTATYFPNTGKAWRWAKVKNSFYYCIDNIPNQAPTHYRSLFGDTESLKKEWKTQTTNDNLAKLRKVFFSYIEEHYKEYLSYYNGLDEVKRKSLAKSCSAVAFMMENKDTYPGTKMKLYNDLSVILKENKIQYLPRNPLRLKEKVTILEETDHSITDIIRLPREGHKGALKYTDPVLFSWLLHLRANGGNFSQIHIIRELWKACDRTGRKKPSERWCKDFLKKPHIEFLTAEKRFGSSKKSNIYKSYIPFEDALYAGDCWQIDATRVNIIAHETKDNEGNKIQKHLMAVVVRDVMSGDILGYNLTYSENKTSFAKALQMAVKRAGYLPYEIVTDKFPGHNTPENKVLIERLESLGVRVRFTHLATDKASVERWFGTFQSVVLMGSKYYYGEGITSTRESAHRSPEYLEKLKRESKKAGFNVVEAVEECESLLEYWRNLKYSEYSRKHKEFHKTPKELHQESEKPHIIEIDKLQKSMLFDRKIETTIRNSGQFHIEVMGVKFHYMISEKYYDVISNYQNQRVVVSYDMEDLSEVHLWIKNGNLLMLLCSVEEFKKVVKYGPNAELGRISQAKARQRRIQEMKEEQYNKIISGVGEEALLMGIHTNKAEANQYEDEYNGLGKLIPLRKASGDDFGEYSPDEFKPEELLNSLNI